MDDPQRDVQRIHNKELRATVVREHRRGITNKNIAGALGLSMYQVEKIIKEDVQRLLSYTDGTRNGLLGPTVHGEATFDEEAQELREKIRNERNANLDRLVEEAKPKTEDDPIIPPPPPPEKVVAKPYTVSNFPHEIAPLHYADHVIDQKEALKRHAFNLRKQGKSYDEIQEATGASPLDVRRWVNEYLSVLDTDELHNTDL